MLNLFDKKLQIPNIKVDRAHILGNKQISEKKKQYLPSSQVLRTNTRFF